MRIQCPRCQELSQVRRFSTASHPPRIVFRCSACGEQVSQEAEGTDASGGAQVSGPEAGVGSAVVSGEGRSAELDKARASGVSPPVSLGEGVPRHGADGLWNLWDRVTDDFSDEARHEAFIAACEVAGRLPDAALRYREWAESHPEDSRAQDRLARIATLAQVKVLLAQGRRHREKDPLRQVLLLALVMLLILAVVVMTAPLVFRGVSDRAGEASRERGPAGGVPRTEPQLQNLRRPASPPERHPPVRPQGMPPGAAHGRPPERDAGSRSPEGQ